MWETRKQIIELIEPYMEKDLAEGCLIIDEFWYIQKIYKPTWENYRYEMMNWQSRIIDSMVKILWHYDITAVLKYIIKNWWKIDHHYKWQIVGSYIRIEYLYESPDDYDYYSFKYKPLNLYTPQEEEALIDLLLKLK